MHLVRRLSGLLVVVVALAAAPAAFAHAKLIAVEPANGATLATAPASVRLFFDDPVAVGPGNAVVSADHRSVLAGSPRLERNDHLLVLPLQPHLPNGDYSVSWRVFSDDGHLESGVLAFRVGAAPAGAGAPRPVLAAASTRPDFLEVLARWLLLGGILIAGGTALFFLLVSRAAVRRTATTMAAALLAAALGGAWLVHAADGAATRFEQVTKVTVIVALVGVVLAALARARPKLIAPALVLPLALLLAPTFAGHAYRAWDGRPISIAADLVHVVAAAFWTGGILQLALLLRGGQDERAVRRFSLYALPAVVLIAGSGLARALVELTAVSQLWSTAYGRAIFAKTVLFAVLIVLGWMSRQALGDPARLWRTVRVELLLLALVVLAVAVLTSLRPGRDVDAAPATIVREVGAAPAPARRSGRLRPPGAGARGRARGAAGHPAQVDRDRDRPDRLRRRRPRRAALGPVGCRQPGGRCGAVRARVLRGLDHAGASERLRCRPPRSRPPPLARLPGATVAAAPRHGLPAPRHAELQRSPVGRLPRASRLRPDPCDHDALDAGGARKRRVRDRRRPAGNRDRPAALGSPLADGPVDAVGLGAAHPAGPAVGDAIARCARDGRERLERDALVGRSGDPGVVHDDLHACHGAAPDDADDRARALHGAPLPLVQRAGHDHAPAAALTRYRTSDLH